MTSQRFSESVPKPPSLLVWSTAILLISLFVADSATAQNRDPEAVFQRAEQLEAKGVDTHCRGGRADSLLERLKNCSDRLENAGGPSFLGLYAPIWQIGTQGNLP